MPRNASVVCLGPILVRLSMCLLMTWRIQHLSDAQSFAGLVWIFKFCILCFTSILTRFNKSVFICCTFFGTASACRDEKKKPFDMNVKSQLLITFFHTARWCFAFCFAFCLATFSFSLCYFLFVFPYRYFLVLLCCLCSTEATTFAHLDATTVGCNMQHCTVCL